MLGHRETAGRRGMARQQWRRHAVATLGVVCAAAFVAVAATDGPMRNSTAAATPGAPAPEMGGLAPPGSDGKAYHHVWPVR